MLLDCVVQVHIVEQDHLPIFAEGTRLHQLGVHPADRSQATLLAQCRANGLQQMAFAATHLTPNIGGHWRAHLVGHPQRQMFQNQLVLTGQKIGQVRPWGQSNVKRDLLHALRSTGEQMAGQITLAGTAQTNQ